MRLLLVAAKMLAALTSHKGPVGRGKEKKRKHRAAAKVKH